MRRASTLLAVVLALTAAACGSDGGMGASGGGHQHGATGSVPGEPADASDSDREIEVEALDELKFEPPSIEVEAGEVVTFVIRNSGSTDHEFVLGDAEYQQEHEAEMAAHGGHMSDTENAVTLTPGETKEVTWHFSESGEVLFGCHEPGHYEGGMVGRIVVG